MRIRWPRLTLPPINLWSAPSQPALEKTMDTPMYVYKGMSLGELADYVAHLESEIDDLSERLEEAEDEIDIRNERMEAADDVDPEAVFQWAMENEWTKEITFGDPLACGYLAVCGALGHVDADELTDCDNAAIWEADLTGLRNEMAKEIMSKRLSRQAEGGDDAE